MGDLFERLPRLIPFPRPFDYDVLHVVLTHCDSSALSALSLLSREFHEDVDPFLWRAIWLPLEEEVQLILAACQAIARVPRRAACVRRLTYGVDRSLPPLMRAEYASDEAYYPPRIHGNPFLAMQTAMKSLVNLEFLHIRSDMYSQVSGRPYAFNFCSVLDSLVSHPTSESELHSPSPSSPFSLKRLQLQCTVFGLNDFLLEQPSIEDFQTTERPRPFWEGIPEATDGRMILSNVRSVAGGVSFLREIIPMRPSIYRLTIRSSKLYTLPRDLSELLTLSRSVKHIVLPNYKVDIVEVFRALGEKGHLKQIEVCLVTWKTFADWWLGDGLDLGITHETVPREVLEKLGRDNEGEMVEMRKLRRDNGDIWTFAAVPFTL